MYQYFTVRVEYLRLGHEAQVFVFRIHHRQIPRLRIIKGAHLMIVQPEKFIPEVKALGAHVMNVHYEACPHLHRVVQQIREAGMQPAVTINPATPVSLLKDIINDVYMVLIMSVNPGFGGQKFIEHSLDKVRELRELITVTGSQALIEVDGGVNLETGSRLVEAGADVLVAGNAVFSAPDPKEAIRALRNL